ncbi:MAG TPA: lipopolysaccharide biosynthesis protein [Gemmatimonadaceae bacterium]|nr:lipopolysaccharide biosynthesis protein [Gemmatimonadaceae bacterium]
MTTKDTSLPSVPVAGEASLKQRVAKNLSWLGIAQALRSITGLAVTAVLARLLTPADFGLVALVLIASGFISMFSETGLTSAVIQRPEVTEDHLSTAFWLNLGVAGSLAAIGVIGAPLISKLFGNPGTAPMLAVMMVSLPIAGLGQVPEAILQRRLAFKAIAAIEWLTTTISGAAAILLAFLGFGAWALVLQAIIAATVGSVGRICVVRWLPRFRVSKAALSDLSSFSFSVFGGNLVNYAFRKIDNFLIGRYLGPAALGYYALAYNLILFPLQSVGAVVLRVMFPVLSSLQADRARLRSAYLRTLRVLGSCTLPVIAGLAATAPLVVLVAYGARWGQTASLLRILSVIGMFESVSTAGILLYAVGRPGVLFRWALVSVVTMTIAFSFALRWGVTGIAWTYVIISPILFVMPHIFAVRAIDLPARRALSAVAPALLSSLAMAAIVVLLRSPLEAVLQTPLQVLLAQVVIGIVAYCAIMSGIAAIRTGGRAGIIPWMLGQHFPTEPQAEAAAA